MKIRYWSYKEEFKKLKSQYFNNLRKFFNSGELILGPEVKKIEKSFSKFLNCKYSVAVNSGTDAILISLMSLGIKRNDEIITTSNTAIPTISAIISSGAKPVYIDIKENDFLIDENKIEKKITKKTKAIIVVHLYGQSPNMKKIMSIAKKYNIKLVEDCAQSLGSTHFKKKLGSFGSISAFSFYPTKVLGAFGDGGMIVTNNQKLFSKIKKIRFYGIKKNYTSELHGINSRLDEIQASLLNVKFKYLNNYINQRRKIAKNYSSKIKNKNLILPIESLGNKHVYYNYVIRVKKRQKLIDYLKKNNIETKIIYPVPVHMMKPYKNLSNKKLNITNKLGKQILSLPIYPGLDTKSQNRIIKVLNNFK